jgi:hypothetical protein
MGTSSSNKILAQTIDSFNSAGLDGTLKLAATLDFPTRLLRIINQSNVPVIISYDGTNAHDVILANSVMQLPFAALGLAGNYSASMAANTNIYVTGSAGTGNIIFAAYYQPINP